MIRKFRIIKPQMSFAAIEMIKPDGTARHTHTLTDSVVLNVSHPDNNSTPYDGT